METALASRKNAPGESKRLGGSTEPARTGQAQPSWQVSAGVTDLLLTGGDAVAAALRLGRFGEPFRVEVSSAELGALLRDTGADSVGVKEWAVEAAHWYGLSYACDEGRETHTFEKATVD